MVAKWGGTGPVAPRTSAMLAKWGCCGLVPPRTVAMLGAIGAPRTMIGQPGTVGTEDRAGAGAPLASLARHRIASLAGHRIASLAGRRMRFHLPDVSDAGEVGVHRAGSSPPSATDAAWGCSWG